MSTSCSPRAVNGRKSCEAVAGRTAPGSRVLPAGAVVGLSAMAVTRAACVCWLCACACVVSVPAGWSGRDYTKVSGGVCEWASQPSQGGTECGGESWMWSRGGPARGNKFSLFRSPVKVNLNMQGFVGCALLTRPSPSLVAPVKPRVPRPSRPRPSGHRSLIDQAFSARTSPNLLPESKTARRRSTAVPDVSRAPRPEGGWEVTTSRPFAVTLPSPLALALDRSNPR